ncbi:hypothetical protein CWB41_11815 [Methylovirgula ligni]|uniref:Uncharacterized protein n=1 Tax=Methylovirgula ligni TaxID=569860 RepID=A0A3D9YWL0_9HYPH|nr:hypothetical protein [Methylovirgula ligni]QAY96331.1 hypothetical protein CWB41_11815 [Methylovirgula ligni]REF85953.1 hypothetical protein DES32_1993 [Methylovirgula ligni]
MRYDVLIVVSLALICIVAVYRRDKARLRKSRAAFFDACLGLFEKPSVHENGAHFPVLSGGYEGFDIKIEPIIDDMSVRKLPSLWLKLWLSAPVPYSGALAVLMRPRGTEFYSPAFDLVSDVEAPAGWPKDVLIRCSDPEDAPPLSLLDRFHELLHDPKCKELLIGPGGVRLIYQAAQAERAEYSVLRHAKFGASTLDADGARQLVDELCAIYRSLARTPHSIPALVKG